MVGHVEGGTVESVYCVEFHEKYVVDPSDGLDGEEGDQLTTVSGLMSMVGLES